MCKWLDWIKSSQIVIWGASIGGEQAITCLRRNGVEPEAFCDNNECKWGTKFQDVEVISPALFKNRLDSRTGEYCIIIASFAWEVIYNQIRDLGFVCQVYIYLLYDPCHLKKGHKYTDAEKEKAYELFEKEEYTRTLLELIMEKGYLNYDGFGKADDFINYGGIDKYYYDCISDKITDKNEKITLIDGGAFVGDSVIQIREALSGLVTSTYAYEPSKENYSEIERKNLGGVTLRKTGLSNRNGFLAFSEKGCFFKVSGNGEGIMIPVVTIDTQDFFIEEKSLLKLDIEGSEKACLEGAVDFIRKNKPYLAVCVYHREMDIIEIPEFIYSIYSGYRFYLRGGMHTVCYAFPD